MKGLHRSRGMRADPVLCACAALLFGAVLPAALVPGVLAAITITLLVARDLGVARVTVVALAFLLGAWRARHSAQHFEAECEAAREAIRGPARCAARAVIASSPTFVRGSLVYVADLAQIDCEGRHVRADLRARLYGGPSQLARGDVLNVVAQLAPVQLFRNLGLPDPAFSAARSGVVASGAVLGWQEHTRASSYRALVDRARAHVRLRIEQTFAPEVRAMARALVLGENDLSPEDDQAFKKSGLSHLLAVSGTHLVVAVLSLFRVLRFGLVRVSIISARWDVSRAAAALAAVLALAYADFAGGSGSAWRAAWMLAAVLVARALGRHPNGVRALALSLGVGAIVDPLAVFDISFLLSACATAGLIWLGQPLSRACRTIPRASLRVLAASVGTTVSAMLPCTPLLTRFNGELTLGGIVANGLAAPCGELVALPFCLAHGVLSGFPFLERGIACVASGALIAVKYIARQTAEARWLAFSVPPPNAWQLALLALCAVAVLRAPRQSLAWIAVSGVLGCALLEHAARRAGAPHDELRISAVDVGQGDATLVDLPDGRVMLIDAGGFVGSPVDPGASVIAPLLRARRRSKLDVLVLTHPHPDHFGGMQSVLRAVSVGEFWDTGQGERDGAGPVYAALLADVRRRNIPIRRPDELCSEARRFGAAELRVLAPCPDAERGIGANDNSIVMRISFGQMHVLLTGDAEAHEEAELIRRFGAALQADLLKVGHHGSRTSTSAAFLQLVKPSVATISSGVRNRFGHPHPLTLDKLRAQGVAVLRLDELGGVIWETTGDIARARSFRAAPLVDWAAAAL